MDGIRKLRDAAIWLAKYIKHAISYKFAQIALAVALLVAIIPAAWGKGAILLLCALAVIFPAFMEKAYKWLDGKIDE